ncbi:MAG: N-acetylmuramoyl-L-alanine amidase [Candidatus Sumerlaeaceae bacterium]|nr:N-acetylmuramoyl-L-alanine amidase [Candidatus Sumerlaeaceae bacterium]
MWPVISRKAILLRLAFLVLLLPFSSGSIHALTVAKISWDSKSQYNRFIMQFDQVPKYNAVNAIKEKGYFYLDLYGLSTNYKRKLLEINDNSVRYVDAVGYPDHGVLRLVFYVKDAGSTFQVNVVDNPPRLVVDTVKGSATEKPDAAGSGAGGKQTTLITSSEGNVEVTGPDGSKMSLPDIPQPKSNPAAGLGKKKLVIIDAGHGGSNNGASSNSKIGGRIVVEKDLTLQFAVCLKRIIDASPNMTALLTRTGDTNLSLEDRVRFAEKQHGDLFVSIHMNDGAGNNSARGVEIYFLSEKGTQDAAIKALESKENVEIGDANFFKRGSAPIVMNILADIEKGELEKQQYESYLVCKQMMSALQVQQFYRQNNRGIKSAGFAVLKNSLMPAVLLEVGFITNSQDLSYLVNPKFQQATAMAMYNGICNYFADVDPTFNAKPGGSKGAKGR